MSSRRPLGLLLLAGVSLHAGAQPACRRDYPIPTTAVDYRKTLAAGTLVPERLVLRGRLLAAGMTEAALGRALGAPPSTADDWQPRSADAQCEFLLELLRRHPDSLHLYRYGELKLRNLAGEFRSLEWTLAGIGRVRAFVHRADAGTAGRTYLLHVAPEPAAIERVRRRPGGRLVFVRAGMPPMEWDVDRNVVSVGAR